MGKKSVYLLQNTNEINEQLKKGFLLGGYDVVGVETDGVKALEEIEKFSPDYLILELVLTGIDGLKVIEEVKRAGLLTKIIVLSALSSEEAVSRSIKAGASYFMSKPFDFNLLLSRLKETEEKTFESGAIKDNLKSIDEKISKIFINVGIPPHIKGYSFLREGVKMAINEPSIINNITKKLYPMIGEKYETSPSKVERAIRHAIEVAWNRGRIDSINSILGVKAYVGQEKPTNGEFIALIADKMLLEMC